MATGKLVAAPQLSPQWRLAGEAAAAHQWSLPRVLVVGMVAAAPQCRVAGEAAAAPQLSPPPVLSPAPVFRPASLGPPQPPALPQPPQCQDSRAHSHRCSLPTCSTRTRILPSSHRQAHQAWWRQAPWCSCSRDIQQYLPWTGRSVLVTLAIGGAGDHSSSCSRRLA